MRTGRAICITLMLLLPGAACTTTGVGVATPSMASATTPMVVPLSTSSATARQEFMLGLRDLDIERGQPALAHFQAAVRADDSFALAHLYAAFASNSLAEFQGHLNRAVQLASTASPAEQLRIQIARRGFDNDPVGQFELAQQLVQMVPTDPRALRTMAGIQAALGRTADARATLQRAVQLSPSFAAAHIQLGNSYLQTEPRDLAQAEAHFRHALALDPNEPYTHDYMGDLYRAKNDLAQARAAYTRMAELDPTRAIAFQQRGHVNSFLGNFAEARADYDRSIAVGTPAEKASYGSFRALVSVHAGDPAAAEQELDRLVAAIDGINPPDVNGAKIDALENQRIIALHSGHLDVAQRATDQHRVLYRKQADQAGTPAVRRNVDATIAYEEGMLAARKGDYPGARSKAQEFMRIVEPNRNPRKNEPAHEILAMADLLQGNHQSAVTHFEQTDPNDLYAVYNHAVALQGAGRNAEAKVLFTRVAQNNFNSPAVALLKRDAARKAAQL